MQIVKYEMVERTGGECVLGTDLVFTSQRPRRSRIVRMTLGSSSEAMTLIECSHRGHTKRSVS